MSNLLPNSGPLLSDRGDHEAPSGFESTRLSAELIDLLTEHVATPADATTRACVIVELVECAVDAIRWRHGLGDDGVEELSSLDIVDSAGDHARRMQRSPLID